MQAKARTDEQLKAAASAPPPSVSDAPPTDAVAAAVAAALEAVQASKAVTPSATSSVDAATIEAGDEVEAEDEGEAGVEAESEGEADDSAFVVWSSRGELPETLVAWGCDEELWRRTKNKKGLIDLMRAGEEAKGRAVRVHRVSEPPARPCTLACLSLKAPIRCDTNLVLRRGSTSYAS